MQAESKGVHGVRDMIMDALIDEGYGVMEALEAANTFLREKIAEGPGTYKFHSKYHDFTITVAGKDEVPTT